MQLNSPGWQLLVWLGEESLTTHYRHQKSLEINIDHYKAIPLGVIHSRFISAQKIRFLKGKGAKASRGTYCDNRDRQRKGEHCGHGREPREEHGENTTRRKTRQQGTEKTGKRFYVLKHTRENSKMLACRITFSTSED